MALKLISGFRFLIKQETILNGAHQKQSVYDGLLLCGMPILYDRLRSACVYENHELTYGDDGLVDTYVSYSATFESRAGRN